MRLGLPLLAILDNQEKIALIAHELAHDVNGDPARTFFIGAAVGALIEWHQLLLPESIPNLFDELRQRMAAMPEYEMKRIRRVEALERSRLDVTHPPTTYRIELLKARRVSGRTVMLPSSESDKLKQELASLESKVQRLLVDRYLAELG